MNKTEYNLNQLKVGIETLSEKGNLKDKLEEVVLNNIFLLDETSLDNLRERPIYNSILERVLDRNPKEEGCNVKVHKLNMDIIGDISFDIIKLYDLIRFRPCILKNI